MVLPRSHSLNLSLSLYRIGQPLAICSEISDTPIRVSLCPITHSPQPIKQKTKCPAFFSSEPNEYGLLPSPFPSDSTTLSTAPPLPMRGPLVLVVSVTAYSHPLSLVCSHSLTDLVKMNMKHYPEYTSSYILFS